MTRWNSFSMTQKVLSVVALGVVLLAFIVAIAYAAGVRCGKEGNYLTCERSVETISTEISSETSTPAQNQNETSTPLSESDNRPEPISVDGDSIVVNDQPAGPIVEVTMLTLAEPGWVAVYEDNNGVPGNVLGAARFEEGIHLGEISLLRSTSPARTYYLILHADTNNREFDLKKNPLVVGSDGLSIRSSFRTFGED